MNDGQECGNDCAASFSLFCSPQDALGTLTRWNCCLAAVSYAYLCKRKSYYELCWGVLTDDELTAVQAARQPPMFVLSIMSSVLKRWAGWGSACTWPTVG